MQIIYLIFLLLMTSIVSSIITTQLPTFKHVFKRVITYFTSSSPKASKCDQKQRIDELENIIDNLAAKVARRENNMRNTVRTEVIKYLNEIKND